jgi:formyltetrahydrofolate-dependent phosphoribosylglycinamide formyltransferase
MEAMIHHQRSNPGCGHETVLVIADRPDAKGLERASLLGIESRCVPLSPDYEDPTNRRVAHEKIVHEHLLAANVDLVLLSGYMRLLTPYLVGHWAPNILNIHPSILPAFPGAHAHRDALASGVNVSGCTVHMVDEGMDTGAILAQRRVPVFPDDTESSLAARVRIEEHLLYPQVVDAFIVQKSFQAS